MTEPAKEGASLWRLGVGVFSVFVAFFVMTTGLSVLVFQVWASGDQAQYLAQSVVMGSTPSGVLIAFGSIGVFAVAAFLVTEIWHKRSGLTLLGPLSLAQQHILKVLPGLAAMMLIAVGLAIFAIRAPLLPGLPFGRWLVFLPLTMLILLVQTASEEILFRGYLQSQLGARFSNPLIWMLVPSLFFGAMHWAPVQYGENAHWPVIFAILVGIVTADLTARSGTLGPAIALHFINNFGVIALVAPNDQYFGLALGKYPFGAGNVTALEAMMPMDLICILSYWLICRIALQR